MGISAPYTCSNAQAHTFTPPRHTCHNHYYCYYYFYYYFYYFYYYHQALTHK